MITINEYQFKSVLAGIGITLLITSLTACDRGADSDMNADNTGASPGYDAGYEFGIKLALLRQQQPGIKLDEALNGLRDALSDTNQYINSTDMCAMLRPAEPSPDEAEFKPAESVLPPQTQERPHGNVVDFTKDDYAALNANREGVMTLSSGVQYEVLKAGSGEQPQAGDTVMISYQAYLPDGTVIDTTDDDRTPLYIPLNDINAAGLKEALLLMNAGARWKIVVPPSMGLGRTGNRMLRRRDLIYDIELISIERAQPTIINY